MLPRKRELEEVLGAGVDVGAGVDQQGVPRRRGEHRADGRAVHAGEDAEDHHRARHDGAGGARADEGVHLALLLQVEADDDGRVLLAPDGVRRGLSHLDPAGRVHDLDAVARRVRVARQLGFDQRLVADQDDGKVSLQLTQSSDRTLDLHGGGTVGAHRVERDPHL